MTASYTTAPHIKLRFVCSGCQKLTDEGIVVISQKLSKLQALTLTWCTLLTDISVEAIVASLPTTLAALRSLKLKHCSLISQEALNLLPTGMLV